MLLCSIFLLKKMKQKYCFDQIKLTWINYQDYIFPVKN